MGVVYCVVIYKKYEDRDFEDIQVMAKYLSENTEKAVIIYSLLDMKLIFSYSGVEDLNCGKIFKQNISNFSGKGGGSNKQAQGSFPDTTKLEAFAQLILKLSIEILNK